MHAHRGEPLDLLGGQHAQRAGDLDVDLVADRLDARGDLGQQPLVGPAHRGDDAELGGAGLGGLLGGLHQAGDVEPALRTGEAKRPDCEQKWQSSGQPPVLRLMMPSTSTSGPHQRHPHLVGQRQQLVEPVVGQLQHLQHLVLVRPSPRSSTCSRATARMSVLSGSRMVGRVAA